MLNSYIPGINKPILSKKHDEHIFSEKVVSEL